MAISPLIIPTRTAASSTGYAGDMNLVIAKINELATSMAISPLTIAAAVGAGSPAADMNQVVAKINEIIGGAPVTAPTGTKATSPRFGTIDDTNNVVGVSSDYSYTEVVVGLEGQAGGQLASNSIFSPGNVAGRAFAYVVANGSRLQSDTVYTSAPFTMAAVAANNAPTVTLDSPQAGKTLTIGDMAVLNASPLDADGASDIKRVSFLDNGVPFAETTGAPHTVQRALASGSHSFTARVYDMVGASGLSNAVVVSGQAVGVAPTITYVTPSSAEVGYPATLIGQNFGATQGSSTVDLNGTPASVNTWSDQQVEIVVPAGATTGRWHLTTAGGTATSSADFTVKSTAATSGTPVITSFSPTSGAPGATVTLTGQNFGADAAVTLNSQAVASVTVLSATQIQVKLAANATAGYFRLTTNGSKCQSYTLFSIILPALTVKRELVFEGDSQVFNYYKGEGDGGLVANILHVLGTTNYGNYFNGGTAGEEIGLNMLSEIPAQFGFPSTLFYDNIAMLYAGINDIIHYANNTVTAQQLYQYAQTWHSRMQSIGWKTAACTICYYAGTQDTPTLLYVNSVIDAYNNMLRANCPGTVLADVNADPRLDPRTHPENFGDGLHFNYNGGSQLVANIVTAAIRSIPVAPAGSMVVDKTLAAFFGTSNNTSNAGTRWVDESGHGNDMISDGNFSLSTDAAGIQVWHSSVPNTSFFNLPLTLSASDYEIYALVNITADTVNPRLIEDPGAGRVILTTGTILEYNPAAYFLGSTNNFAGRSYIPLNKPTLLRWRFDSVAKLGGSMNTAGLLPTSSDAYAQPFYFSGGAKVGDIQGDIYALAIVPRLLSREQSFAWASYLMQQAGLSL